MKMRVAGIWMCLILLSCGLRLHGQAFYFGNDLSYVNEMEDCGVTYLEDGEVRDVYEIFQDHGCNLVRLRLWHTPAWYDNLNSGNRYSDFADVQAAIARARAHGMQVLLDFHLSDNWADPGKQVVPAAWAPVVDDLPVLKDSLFNYIHRVLTNLDAEGLLPEMVQIGNETNKGILQSQAANDGGWVLDWDRNSQLFNRAIDAVEAVEQASGKDIRVAIHVADPKNAVWLFKQFIDNGVTRFDVMGISYYWAWHKPTDIDDTGDIIAGLIADYPGYDVMILETGYIWTTESNDSANNIISDVHPDYSPASPDNQREWLIALTQEVINRGGKGVIYWEPAWVSSPCWTQWGRGSHQEHATFFDFDNHLIADGGIAWMSWPYEHLTGTEQTERPSGTVEITVDSNQRQLLISVRDYRGARPMHFVLVNASGQVIGQTTLAPVNGTAWSGTLRLPDLLKGMYIGTVTSGDKNLHTEKFLLGD